MKLLIIEDDSSIRNVLRMSLEASCFTVDTAEDGEQGSYMARTNEYNLIILDNMLPKKLGKKVCQEVREAGKTTPIILLSMKSDILEKVSVLDAGADDYMTKPFSFEELLARIRALTRRPRTMAEKVLKIKDIELNTDRNIVTKDGAEIELTKKEFNLLEYLLQNKERVVTRGQIMEHVWDINADPFSNTIESHIVNLRKKIGDHHKRVIKNIPGRGYKITETCLV
ncbi:MAG: response regulator transcription factor [Candidatus Paceibacterota bacterium]